MKIPSIELGNISRFRAEQMGAAMLFVILFHVALDRGDPFYGLRRCGNVGVDIFLFLSGVGLWFAWTKTPSVSHFYRRRLIRILPTWLICSTAFYLRDYLGARRFSKDIVDLIGDITINWDFWLHDELTFWYVPAIMALYLVAPWYMRLIERYPTYRWLPMLMVVWCVMVQWCCRYMPPWVTWRYSGVACLSSSSASTWARWFARASSCRPMRCGCCSLRS